MKFFSKLLQNLCSKDSPILTRIIVKQRDNGDYIEFIAEIEGCKYFEAGKTLSQAIGELHIRYPELFGEVVFDESMLEYLKQQGRYSLHTPPRKT